MTMTTAQPDKPAPTPEAHGVAEARGLFDGEILRHALVDSVKKLWSRRQALFECTHEVG